MTCFFETSISTHATTQGHIPADRNVHISHKLKCRDNNVKFAQSSESLIRWATASNEGFCFMEFVSFRLLRRVRKKCGKRPLPSSCLSVRPHGISRLHLKGFWLHVITVFFENMFRKCNFHYNLTRITGTLHEDLGKFMIKVCSVLLRVRNIADYVVEKIKTRILYPVKFFQKSCCSCDNVDK